MNTEEFGEKLQEIVVDRKVMRSFLGIERLRELAKSFHEGIMAQYEKNLKSCEDKVDRFIAEENKI